MEKKMTVNKWNGSLYEVVKETGKEIELKRCSDGNVFSILKSEYAFSYKPFKKVVEKWLSSPGFFPNPTQIPEEFLICKLFLDSGLENHIILRRWKNGINKSLSWPDVGQSNLRHCMGNFYSNSFVWWSYCRPVERYSKTYRWSWFSFSAFDRGNSGIASEERFNKEVNIAGWI